MKYGFGWKWLIANDLNIQLLTLIIEQIDPVNRANKFNSFLQNFGKFEDNFQGRQILGKKTSMSVR
jgi:hypothetical protein